MNKVGRADVDTVCVQRLITLDILVIRRPPSISDSEAQSYRRFYSFEAISSSEEVCGASTVIRSSWWSPKAMPLTQWHSKGAVAEDLTIPTAWTPTLPLVLGLVRAIALGFLAEEWCDYGNSSLTNTSLFAFPSWSTYRSSSGRHRPLDTQTVPCWSATSLLLPQWHSKSTQGDFVLSRPMSSDWSYVFQIEDWGFSWQG